MIAEIIISIFLISGSIFVLVASVGVLRLPDLMMKMHASTKAGTLGAGLILVSVGVAFDEISVLTRVIATIIFLLLTAPVAAHLISRAAYYVGMEFWEGTITDELKKEKEAAETAGPHKAAKMTKKASDS
jgi:multicomponent Na+:H+ antiporter subunit G